MTISGELCYNELYFSIRRRGVRSEPLFRTFRLLVGVICLCLRTKVKERGFTMEIAIIAHDLKKELMTQFCIAYCGILSKHKLCATGITAKYISEATGLEIERMMAGVQGGKQQIASRISCNEIDILLYFKDTRQDAKTDEAEAELLRLCDLYNIPVATNIATAEAVITALDRGDLDWREVVNPRSEYNRKLRAENNRI